MSQTNQERMALRYHLEPWRNWFKLARWRDLCAAVFERDGFTCQCGCGCKPELSHLVGGHVTPHGGKEALFWDPANVRTLSKDCRDRIDRERRKQRPRGVWD